MSRRLSIALMLAIVAVASATYVYVRNRPVKAVEPTPATERFTHVGVPSSDIYFIDIQRRGSDRLTFERDTDGEATGVWRVLSPELTFSPKLSVLNEFAFAISSMWSDRIIDAAPDLNDYGLVTPAAILEVRATDQDPILIRVGDKTPSGTGFYMQKTGDDSVFALRNYNADKLFSDVTTLRERSIGVPNAQELTYLRIENERSIEIVPVSIIDSFDFSAPGAFKVVTPYLRQRPIDSQRLQETLESLPPAFSIVEFIDDAANDLALYGLQDPKYQFEIRDAETELELHFGLNASDEEIFAKRSDQPGVFTLSRDIVPLLETEPFELIDKFMLLVNIQHVDSFTVSGFGRTYTAAIDRRLYDEEEDEVYTLDGIVVDESLFKDFYQLVIGFLTDAENPETNPMVEADVSVVYDLNDEVGPDSVRIDFVRINRDFYAAYQNGVSEFLVSDYQVEDVFAEAERLRENPTEE